MQEAGVEPRTTQDETSDESSSPSSSLSSLVHEDHERQSDDNFRASNPKRYYFADKPEPVHEPNHLSGGPDLIPETSRTLRSISRETSPVSSPIGTRQPAGDSRSAARATSPRPEPTKLTDSIQLVRAPENPDRARSCSPNSSSIPVKDIAKLFEPLPTSSLKSSTIWKSLPNLSKPPVKATASCPPNGQPARNRNVRVVSSAIPAADGQEVMVCTIVPIKERKRIFEGLAESENKQR